jgi:nicotinamide-nucleotide amidase
MRTADVEKLIVELGGVLRGADMRLATAESCTGGLVACCLTNVAGSSEWFEGGVVAYDNRVKMKLLGVSEDVLILHGAVSAACVEAMARGIVA